jgi:transcription elongation GreA/GreB family factor
MGASNDRPTANEEAFVRRLEEAPEDNGFFFEVTRALKKQGEKEKPRVLLQRLAAVQKELGLAAARLDTLIELARAFPQKAPPSSDWEAAIREAYPGHPTLDTLIAFYLKPPAPPADSVEKIRRWLPFTPGAVFHFPAYGAGRVVDIKPAIDSVRLEFGPGKTLSVPPGAAARSLVPLPPGDFRREKLEDLAGMAARSKSDPVLAVRHLIESVGKPQTIAEIKDAFTGIVAPAEWAAFWAAARKHPQLVLSGSGKNAVYGWSDSAQAAHDTIRAEFDRAGAARRLELARKHARRSELASHFAESLAACAFEVAADDPALAVEITFFLEALRPPVDSGVSPVQLLAGPRGVEIAQQIGDPSARIQAYRSLSSRPDWPEVAASLFLREEDSRSLSYLESALRQSAPEARESLLARVLRSPRGAPRAFLWLFEKRDEVPGISDRIGHELLVPLIESLRTPEFSPFRARLKTLFDRGGLALSLVAAIPTEADARRVWTALERSSGLEEFRRDDMKQALVRRFPELSGPRVEPLYVTVESLARRKAELDQLVKVEIPATGRAIQDAAAMGDLRENFEYHAARARQEFLAVRLAQIREEISRARPIEPARTNTAEVRVGTRVRLAAGDRTRDVTILGPWDSKPEAGIYSYQSDFAGRMLAKRLHDRVEIEGEEWTIAEIAPWEEPAAR